MIVVTGDLHTKLLLHGDSFIDGSKDKRVITNTGVAVSTVQSKFGDSSFYFDGSAYLTAPGYDFSTDDFTIDWWEYPTNANAGTRFTNVYCTSYATQAGGILLYVNQSNLQVYLSNKTGGAAMADWNVLVGKTLGNNVVNTWTHRAIVRSGSSLMFFKNGLLEYTYDIGTNKIGYSSDRPWGIGNWASDVTTTGYSYIGYIDEFRVSDIARWTESFTPPTEPYPDSNIEILPGGVIPMQWALRRRMMMAALGSGIDVAALSITYTGTHTDYGMVTMSDGARYRLLAFTSSGTLSIEQPVNCEVCVVGGGANGGSTDGYGSQGGVGGAGAYLKNQSVSAYNGGPVVVGARQGVSSIAGVSVNAVSGRNGGTGAGGYVAGTGDGISKYPFEDTGYSLWAGKPHCGGGGGGGLYYQKGPSRYNSKKGGNGGTNGGNGGIDTNNNSHPGGSGGAYGGGSGGNGGAYLSEQGAGKSAAYYGSGGGGAGQDNVTGGHNSFTGGSGYQGIVYIRIPEEQTA